MSSIRTLTATPSDALVRRFHETAPIKGDDVEWRATARHLVEGQIRVGSGRGWLVPRMAALRPGRSFGCLDRRLRSGLSPAAVATGAFLGVGNELQEAAERR